MLRIKFLREARGLNMRETAKLLGIPYTTYVNYEKGSREPTSEMLITLAEFFNVSTDYLLGRDSIEPDSTYYKTLHWLKSPPEDTHESVQQEQWYESSPSTEDLAAVISSLEGTRVFHLYPEEINLINKYRILDARGQAAVLNVLNHEYDSLPGEKAGSPAKEA